MDTRTGEIFSPETMKDYFTAVDAAADMEGALARVDAAVRRGELVSVSDRVAQAQRLGRRELERRMRRRKAAKQARKRNR